MRDKILEFNFYFKRKEREEADLREAEHQKFMEEVLLVIQNTCNRTCIQIRQRAAERKPLALVPVELGPDLKPNLTLIEGNDLKETGTWNSILKSISMFFSDDLLSSTQYSSELYP